MNDQQSQIDPQGLQSIDPSDLIVSAQEKKEEQVQELTREQQREPKKDPRFLYYIKVPNECREKQCTYHSNNLPLGSKVLFNTEKGLKVGTVSTGAISLEILEPAKFDQILREANYKDLSVDQKIKDKEEIAFSFCKKKIVEHDLEMKLIRVETIPRETKMVFHFIADKRVDFRGLVKDLAGELRMRIQMIQIGVRDESRLVGALGPCGRECCCSSYLKEFATISIKMAKQQNLALNPQKLSGMCGRLKCCLSYENQFYCQMVGKFPSAGSIVEYNGKEWEVSGMNVIKEMISLTEVHSGETIVINLEELGGKPLAYRRKVDAREQIDENLRQLEDDGAEQSGTKNDQAPMESEPPKPESNQNRRSDHRQERRPGNRLDPRPNMKPNPQSEPTATEEHPKTADQEPRRRSRWRRRRPRNDQNGPSSAQ